MGKEYCPKRFSEEEFSVLKKKKASGRTYKSLAEEYGVAQPTMVYYLNEKCRKIQISRLKKYQKSHPEETKLKHKKYMHSLSGKRSVAKSWLRKYLRDGVLCRQDVLEILNDSWEVKN